MSFIEATGFFAEYYLNLKNSIQDFDKKIEQIKDCKNDLERIRFIENFECVQEHDDKLQIERATESKNVNAAADLKEKGNLAFKTKQWLEAMVLYTKSYIALPEDKCKYYRFYEIEHD